ncbi:hypothetical protein QBC46DRAFT_357177 [Diplogelasinospora grovesii]|uniref:F-box domain-containing protein n=1 Tax=Diplogelasinospora grovesii TaxID=303347 RepID=A0AAN6N0C5_9PEZI|nr:hypothetical protein QBC46DRAFT_357177 [Diplogelasinospora grovesii]
MKLRELALEIESQSLRSSSDLPSPEPPLPTENTTETAWPRADPPVVPWGQKLKSLLYMRCTQRKTHAKSNQHVVDDINDPKPAAWPLWQVNRKRNAEQNPFCRLPDEVLLLIMGHLVNRSDLYVLRQVCSVFRRICDDRVFKLLALHDFMKLHPSQANDVAERLHRGDHCAACNKMRGIKPFEAMMVEMAKPLYCSGCKHHHPSVMFSPAQREAALDVQRICLGREGSGIRLCPHHLISWGDVEKWSDDAQFNEEVIKSCGNQRFDFLECTECFRDLHQPTGACIKASWRPWRPKPEPKPERRMIWPGPKATLSKSTFKISPTCLKISWSLPVLRWTGDDDGGLSEETLRIALDKIPKNYNTLLCDHITLDDGQLLRGMFTNSIGVASCTCFRPSDDQISHFDVRDKNNDDGASTHITTTSSWDASSKQTFVNTTRSNRASCLRHMCPPFVRRKVTPEHKAENVQPAMEMCEKAVHHHVVKCRLCRVEYVWKNVKTQDGRYLVLKMERLIRAHSPSINCGFYEVCDPLYWRNMREEKTKHITWCDDRKCRNGRGWGSHLKYVRRFHDDW